MAKKMKAKAPKAKARKKIEPRKRKATPRTAAVAVDPELRTQTTISTAQVALEDMRERLASLARQSVMVNEGVREEYRAIAKAGPACTERERARLVTLWDYIQLTQAIAKGLTSVLSGEYVTQGSAQARGLVSAWQGKESWPDPALDARIEVDRFGYPGANPRP